MEKLDQIIANFKESGESLIALLQDLSREIGYLPEESLHYVSKQLDIPLGKLFSLATFYNSFRMEPLGKHHICVCVGTACHVKGAQQIVDTLERELGIKPGDRTADNQFSLETVNCLGTCALGPLVVADDEYHGNMNQKKIKSLLSQIRKGQ